MCVVWEQEELVFNNNGPESWHRKWKTQRAREIRAIQTARTNVEWILTKRQIKPISFEKENMRNDWLLSHLVRWHYFFSLFCCFLSTTPVCCLMCHSIHLYLIFFFFLVSIRIRVRFALATISFVCVQSGTKKEEKNTTFSWVKIETFARIEPFLCHQCEHEWQHQHQNQKEEEEELLSNTINMQSNK